MPGIGHNKPPPGNAMEDALTICTSLRVKRGSRTQEKVASGAGMTRQALQLIEAGKTQPRLFNACMYARALGYRLALVPLEEGK